MGTRNEPSATPGLTDGAVQDKGMGVGIDARGEPSEIVGEEVGDSGFMRVGVGDVDAD